MAERRADNAEVGCSIHSPCTKCAALEKALQGIMQVLGPTAPLTCCSGCEYEINEALRLCREVGIEYRSRKG